MLADIRVSNNNLGEILECGKLGGNFKKKLMFFYFLLFKYDEWY